MKAKYIGDKVIIEITIFGEDFIIISSDDLTDAKNALGNCVLTQPTESESKHRMFMNAVKDSLKNQGWYFKNPSKYYQQCLGCNRYLTYENRDKCCGSLYVLPEWKKYDKKVLSNLQVYKKPK